MSPIPAGEEPSPPPTINSWELSLPEQLRGGDATKFSFAIESISIGNDGPALQLPSPGVTAIVGGNNVGKSTLLRQINQLIPQLTPTETPLIGGPPVLRDIELGPAGDSRDLAAWLFQHAVLQQPNPDVVGSMFQFSRPGAQQVPAENLHHHWTYQLAPLASHLVYFADARSRHQWTSPAVRRANFTDPPSHPLHAFELNSELRTEISQICYSAFHKYLTIDPLSGQLMFRVGVPDHPAPPVDEITPEYVEALSLLPPLADQGDGMVFMMGALMPIIAATFPVILLDEPEAFLHPPQAFLMGQSLARLAAQRDIQILVATHDRNILRGLLDVPTTDVAIVRLTRLDNVTSASLLPVEDVRKISTNAIFRYTNILDGLFHQLVVLAENERDCRFYQAALDYAAQAESLPLQPHDVLFVPTSGKGNMAATARVLKNTGVRVVASPDLDILDDEGTLKALVEALGANWDTELKTFYRRSTDTIRNAKKGKLNKDVLHAASGILNEEPDALYDKNRAERVRNAIASASPWEVLKEQGKYAMKSDIPAREALLNRLDQLGLVTVIIGELEAFDRDAPHDKNRWLPIALEHNAHHSAAALDHSRRLVGASGSDPSQP